MGKTMKLLKMAEKELDELDNLLDKYSRGSRDRRDKLLLPPLVLCNTLFPFRISVLPTPGRRV